MNPNLSTRWYQTKNLPSLIQALEIIKFGEFTLKSGATSSYYLDFRESLGHPKLFRTLGAHMSRLAQNFDFDLICGVPYAAVPLSTMMALHLEQPLLMCRKEVKKHGQKNVLEGLYKPGDTCLLIEDVVSTGGSVLEAVRILRQEGLKVENCLSLTCRNPDTFKTLQEEGIKLHTLMSLEDLLDVKQDLQAA